MWYYKTGGNIQMGTENQNDASGQHKDGGTQDNTPQGNQPPAGVDNAPKLEVKTEGDKQVMMVDGKKVVFEHELIAAKKSLEQQAEEAQQVHNEAIDKAQVALSDSQQKLAAANADVTRLTDELGKARESGATPEDVAKLKQDVESANTKVTEAEVKASGYRKQLIMASYPGVTEDQLADKTPEQLDALEEALKAVAGSRKGAGPYAIGGGNGGTAPLSDEDRAKALIESTPYRGVREKESQT
jgi:hypothetical protein